jgi:hypothetical protein
MGIRYMETISSMYEWIYEHITTMFIMNICFIYICGKYALERKTVEERIFNIIDMAYVFMVYCVIYMIQHK